MVLSVFPMRQDDAAVSSVFLPTRSVSSTDQELRVFHEKLCVIGLGATVSHAAWTDTAPVFSCLPSYAGGELLDIAVKAILL